MNIRKIIYLFIILIMGILQVTLLDSFKIFNVKPDLLLISVILATLIFELRWALSLGIVAAILKDSLGASVFGVNTILFPLWIFLVMKISRKIPLDNNLIRMALVFIIVIAHNIITRVIFFVSGNSLAPLAIFFWVTFLESLYTTAILPLALRIFKFLPYPIEIE